MRHILIIEDDEINCMIYEEILSNDHTVIDFAYDGQQGIDKFKEKKYDLILLDLGLPKIGGLQVAQLIKEYEAKEQLDETTPIIVITADGSSDTRRLSFSAGVNEFLTKPFDIKQLENLVDQYVKDNDKQDQN